MHTTVIGGIVQATLTKRDIKVLWQALKSLEKFGTPSSCVGTFEEDELQNLLTEITKACNQRFTHNGALSKDVATIQAERQAFYGIIHNSNLVKQAEIEKQEQIEKQRRIKLQDDIAKRRCYPY